MAKVSLDINGRKYVLGCDDGEEARLAGLGSRLDARVKSLANQFGQIGDLRLLVMAGITMMDEIDEMQNNIETKTDALSQQMKRDSEAALTAAKKSEFAATDSLLKAAERIDVIAARLAQKD